LKPQTLGVFRNAGKPCKSPIRYGNELSDNILTESEYGVKIRKKQMSETDKTIYINDFTTISDILNNPLFEGFGQFIFPIKNIPDFDMNTRLYDIKKLLPYHNKKSINTNTTINVIKYMLDEVNNGRKIFYDFYTDHHKCDDSGKISTGLFFFRGKKNAPFAVICAGGGNNYVGSIHGSFPIALELSKKGYNAFAIEYRLGEKQKAIEDLTAAISYIFKNSETLEISTNNYSIWGGSAGARMADAAGSGLLDFEGVVIPLPSMVVIAYTGSFGTLNYPPTFAFVSEDDSFYSIMDQSVKKMRNAGIDVEFHKYKKAGHGFALGIGTEAEGWINNAVLFWEKHMK
jgi:acetyl esterase/lipase